MIVLIFLSLFFLEDLKETSEEDSFHIEFLNSVSAETWEAIASNWPISE